MAYQSERNIPHMRDIFGYQAAPHHSYNSGYNNYSSRHRDGYWNEEALVAKMKDVDLQQKIPGNDSAVSVGSSDEDDVGPARSRNSKSSTATNNYNNSCRIEASPPKSKKKSKKEERTSRKDIHRTMTERDVKHLERHLSMKKTIRKKIMRDLQQAFVEDPNEFKVDPRRVSPDRMKGINIQNISFNPPCKKGQPSRSESNFLDMLRDENGAAIQDAGAAINDDDSGNGSPTRESACYANQVKENDDSKQKSSSFWKRFTMKGKSKR